MFKRKKFYENPYGFNINEEYEFYKGICNNPSTALTYAKWKEHILSHIINIDNEKKSNSYNLKHYLINKHRKSKNSLNMIANIIVPVYILLLTLYFALLNKFFEFFNDIFKKFNYIAFPISIYLEIAIVILLLIAFVLKYIQLSTYVNFYDDIIDIIDEYSPEKWL